MGKLARLILACLGFLCLNILPAHAQENLGSINGTVTDSSVVQSVTPR